jgi:hypothetical protein
MSELDDILSGKGRTVHNIKELLLQEGGELVWYHRQNFAERLKELEAKIRENEKRHRQLEGEHPELARKRDEAKRYLDDVRARRIPEALDDAGNTPAAILQDARQTWMAASSAEQSMGQELSSLRLATTFLRNEVEKIKAVEPPQAPTLAELVNILGS